MREHKKVLIVDSQADSRRDLNQRLHKSGHQVFQAVDETSGLEVLKDIQMDLVFLGSTSGSHLEFWQKLRELSLGRNCPFLFISQPQAEMIPETKGVEYLPGMKLEEIVLRIDKRLTDSPQKILRKFKILVAGPESDVIRSMTQQLKKRDYEYQSAATGSETITKAVQMIPDMLVMDVLIGGVSSPEIIRLLRQMPQFGKNPILVYCYYLLSNLDRLDMRERLLSVEDAVTHCKEAGADEYIGRYNETAFLESLNKYFA
jgi:CheY-like chemotaxis protein